MLSGIGPPGTCAASHRPGGRAAGTGANLQDHPVSMACYAPAGPVPAAGTTTARPTPRCAARWQAPGLTCTCSDPAARCPARLRGAARRLRPGRRGHGARQPRHGPARLRQPVSRAGHRPRLPARPRRPGPARGRLLMIPMPPRAHRSPGSPPARPGPATDLAGAAPVDQAHGRELLPPGRHLPDRLPPGRRRGRRRRTAGPRIDGLRVADASVIRSSRTPRCTRPCWRSQSAQRT